MVRLRPQFSLRSLLIAIAILGISLGGFLAWWQRIQTDEQVLGQCRWDHEEMLVLEEWQREDANVPAFDRAGTGCRTAAQTYVAIAGHTTPRYREVYTYYLDLRGNPLRHGLATTYDLEGHKLREESWRHGRLDGSWTDWHPDGAKLAEGTFRAGEPDGEWVSYFVSDYARGAQRRRRYAEFGLWLPPYVSGSFDAFPDVVVEHYTRGLRTSISGWDAARQHLLCEAECAGDQFHGNVVWRSLAGTIVEELHFDHGRPTGVSQAWYEDGTNAFRGAYNAGQPAGQWTKWYRDGTTAWEGCFEDGKEQGPWAWWHENGVKAARGAYAAGNQHGPWTWWHADGRVECRAEFSSGRLLSLRSPQIAIQGLIDLESSRRLFKALEEQTTCDFNRTTFKDVATSLAESHHICIRLSHRATTKPDIADTRITYHSPRSDDGKGNDMTLHAALQHVLEPLGLVPVIRHDLLLITTRQDAEKWRDRSGVQQLFQSGMPNLEIELQKPTQIEFNETSLSDACQYLSQLHNINLNVDPSLSEEDQQLPITAVLKSTSLAAALEFLCDQYGLMCTDTGKEVLVGRASTEAAGERRGVSPP